MTDIDLYEKSADTYENLQERRPDYVGARQAFYDLASIHLKGKTKLAIAYFCCGTGNNTKIIADKFSVAKATLIDINRQFLEIAKTSNIRAIELETIESDILKVNLKPEHAAVISMFAYHHVPDKDKKKFIQNAKAALKKSGIVLLGEIYSPDKVTTLAYYEHLLNSIEPNLRTPELEKFLRQTAESDEFEYKVSREFAHKQLNECGFKLLDTFKVWPTDKKFEKNVGTFVEVLQAS